MNKTFVSILTICGNLLLGSITGAATLDSLQSRLQTHFTVLATLQETIHENESEMTRLTKETAGIDGRENLNWIQHRRIVRHKARLSVLNDEINRLTQTQSEILETIQPSIREYYRIVSDSLELTLRVLEMSPKAENHQRQLAVLLHWKQRRDWLLQKQSKYSTLPAPLAFPQNDLIGRLENHPNRASILADLRNLLNEKVTEIEGIITAAREEQLLRDRMDQFSSEMTAIAGEVSGVNAAGTQLAEKGWQESLTGDSYANGPTIDSERGTDTEILIQSYTDYTPAFLGGQPQEMEQYISYLDSLRRTYQKMIMDIQ